MPMLSKIKILKRHRLDRFNITRYLLYAVGEVILIFAGITLSIWFTNWNEAKKERNMELHILKELKQSFLFDLTDQKLNVGARQMSKGACMALIRAIEEKLPYHDSLDIYFANAFLSAESIIKSSAYENLKSRGVHTITNEDLRLQIINIHDVLYPTIRKAEVRHADLFFNTLVQFNSMRFDNTNPYIPLKPVNYDALLKDHQFIYYLKVLIFYNDFQLDICSEIETEVNRVIKNIDKELE